ncbi:MAG: DUF1684 domain-containing protein [Candidatus Dormibacteraeota bacterium]|nr:DUF1684 domain-containing protein [Candidatus Dormibacteraeota bacterium]
MAGNDYLDLVDWRRRVGDLYRLRGPRASEEFRRGKDELFRSHSQSPIDDPSTFSGLDYFPVDPAYRTVAVLVPEAEPGELVIDTGGADGVIRYRRAGRLQFALMDTECSLLVLSLIGYGGGLFVPFKDATSRTETYGGGRYLFDTVKNTDGLVLEFATGSSEVTIDFNYAYNPSCAYSARWACPLAPPENVLPIAVRAGERIFRP